MSERLCLFVVWVELLTWYQSFDDCYNTATWAEWKLVKLHLIVNHNVKSSSQKLLITKNLGSVVGLRHMIIAWFTFFVRVVWAFLSCIDDTAVLVWVKMIVDSNKRKSKRTFQVGGRKPGAEQKGFPSIHLKLSTQDQDHHHRHHTRHHHQVGDAPCIVIYTTNDLVSPDQPPAQRLIPVEKVLFHHCNRKSFMRAIEP